jgi:uncharacterized protein
MMGGLIGAGLAEVLPGRDLALIITAAVLVALVLLFTKLKQAIESAASETVRYSVREFLLFTGIGVWPGFIVLDGATYLLLALTLAAGLPFIHANAVKSAVLVPTTIVALSLSSERAVVLPLPLHCRDSVDVNLSFRPVERNPCRIDNSFLTS